MFVDVVQGPHQNLIYLLGDRLGVLLDMLHLGHDLLQLLLDDMLFLAKRDVFGDGFSAGVCVSVLDSQDSLVAQLSRGEAGPVLLHVRRDYALTA